MALETADHTIHVALSLALPDATNLIGPERFLKKKQIVEPFS
jgi:hypothetical protein